MTRDLRGRLHMQNYPLILWTQFSHYDVTTLTATPVELRSAGDTVGFFSHLFKQTFFFINLCYT